MIGSGKWRMAEPADLKTNLVEHLALGTAYVTDKSNY